jgi:hypothetical protein
MSSCFRFGKNNMWLLSRFFQLLALLAPSLTLTMLFFLPDTYTSKTKHNIFAISLKRWETKRSIRGFCSIATFHIRRKWINGSHPCAMGVRWFVSATNKAAGHPCCRCGRPNRGQQSRKKEMLRLMVGLGDEALIPLQQVRYDLISELKLERSCGTAECYRPKRNNVLPAHI